MPRALASLVALSFPAEDSANSRLAGLSVTARGAYAESSQDELGFLHGAFTHDLKLASRRLQKSHCSGHRRACSASGPEAQCWAGPFPLRQACFLSSRFSPAPPYAMKWMMEIVYIITFALM